MSDWNLLSGDAVRQVRQLVAEQLANGRPAPEKMHLRRRPTFSAEENSIIYRLVEGIEGHGGTASNPVVNTDYPSAWLGATRCYGSQSHIEYDASETTPSTNGNFVVNTTGRYRFVFSGTTTLQLYDTPPANYQTVYTDYQLTSPNNHRHEVLTPFEMEAAGAGFSPLLVQLYRKPDGGSMAEYEDAASQKRRAFFHGRAATIAPDSKTWVNMAHEWDVDLTAGDRFSLNFALAYPDQEYWQYKLQDTYGTYLRIEYIGESLSWEAV